MRSPEYGQALRFLRQARGLSLREVATCMGVSVATVSLAERTVHGRRVTLRYIEEFARVALLPSTLVFDMAQEASSLVELDRVRVGQALSSLWFDRGVFRPVRLRGLHGNR